MKKQIPSHCDVTDIQHILKHSTHSPLITVHSHLQLLTTHISAHIKAQHTLHSMSGHQERTSQVTYIT